MKRLVKVVPLMVVMALMVSCGSSSNEATGDESGVTTIDGLPRATSPVVDSVTGNLAVLPTKAVSVAKATTGILMRTFGDAGNTFTSGQSMAACQASNQLKQLFNAAANGDKILCYIQNTYKNYPNSDVIYDGNFHAFDLNVMGGPDHIKMKITKNASGRVTNFEFFACSGGTENQYISQTISGSDFEMTSKNIWNDGGGTGGQITNVTGTLNSDGNFTSTKRLEFSNYWGDNNYGGWSEGTFDQEAAGYAYNGYEKGTFSDGQNSGSYENRVYSLGQLIDTNDSADIDEYDIGLLAMGDGAAHLFVWGTDGVNEWDNGAEGETLGWDGDTKLDDNTVSYVSDVETETPVEAGSQPSVTFTEGDSDYYDCGDESEETIEPDMETLGQVCANYELGYDWVNCWDLTAEE